MTSEQNATTAGTRPRTLAEKVWDAHVVVPGEMFLFSIAETLSVD